MANILDILFNGAGKTNDEATNRIIQLAGQNNNSNANLPYNALVGNNLSPQNGSSIYQPMPTSQNVNTQQTQQQPRKDGFTFRNLLESIVDTANGWASGRTPSESLANGGLYAQQGLKERRAQNETEEWLSTQGYTKDQAQKIVQSPQVLAQVLAGITKNNDPSLALQRAKLGLEVEKLQNPNDLYSFSTTPDGTVLRANKKTGEAEPVFQAGVRPTANMQEYEAAKNEGFKGNLVDFIGQKKNTNVNVNGANVDTDNLPPVSVGEDGLPIKEQQQQYLESLPKSTADLVKGVASGEMQLDKIASLRGNQRQQLAAIVKGYDPTFDMSQASARFATRKDYASGEMAKAAASTNLAVQHLGGLYDAYQKLGNSSYPSINRVKNFIGIESGDPNIQAFNTYKAGLADEISKTFKGVGAISEEERRTWMNLINSSSSPEQLKAAVLSLIHMLSARTNTYNQRWRNTMGSEPPQFLNSQSVNILKKMGIDPSELDPRYQNEKQTEPIEVSTEQDYKALPSGTVFRAPDGSVRKKP